MHGLGDLEAAVMGVLWREQQSLKVRDVLDRLGGERPRAYTTVLTVLDNLHRKAWVNRELRGKAFWYEPAVTRAEAAARALRQVIASSGDPEAVLLQFAQSATDREFDLLRKALSTRRTKP
ncbi:BlaI/MecI/CopY family transcriptional regulator [Lentzea sp. BCCO 10_0061]|uniref:BlaI/MecI/CopY family transcriptional regulator n=1 Tax=Lentzea sokolovensis TaxID=3095429 RepID=A0ABU4UUJ5_9PSEU|nr:BlaI/MecI/CopY family transcriptional regulator [Lentzea sp. BCCO 10_0061]MDX8143182.1 BlaI/MecI/CopY family transcriptional regulator [Lentzea sp. BCCO 10_0061]